MKMQSRVEIKIYLVILWALVMSAISTIINFKAYCKGYMPSTFQSFFSVFCVLSWVLTSFYCGYKKHMRYLIYCSMFWWIGLFLFILGYITGILTIGILPIIVIAGPLYGLRYFTKMPSDISLVIINVSISYLLMLVGFLIGKYFSIKNYKQH